MTYEEIIYLLGDEAEYLLNHRCLKIPKSTIHHPSPYHVEEIFRQSDRSEKVIRNLHRLYGSGRLADTGYLSIFPVDQGVEHTAGYSFAKNPLFFDPENIVKLAYEAGCSGVASTLGILGLVSRKYADKIPLIVKINHNELLTYPNKHDQVMFASVRQAYNMGAIGIGATIYFGSEQSNRQIEEVSRAFAEAHELGLLTILWCYPRNSAFETPEADFHEAADITGQANYLGVTIEADIIKQKLPTNNGGFKTLDFAKYNDEMYDGLVGNHPINLVRYQLANTYMGKISLINSGGAYGGNDDWRDAIRTAVINKRGGGAGLIMGRKIFNRPFSEGVRLIQAVQDVYLEPRVGLA